MRGLLEFKKDPFQWDPQWKKPEEYEEHDEEHEESGEDDAEGEESEKEIHFHFLVQSNSGPIGPNL